MILTDGRGTGVSTDTSHDIPIYIDVGFDSEAWVLFGQDHFNKPDCTTVDMHDIVNSELLLITVVLSSKDVKWKYSVMLPYFFGIMSF